MTSHIPSKTSRLSRRKVLAGAAACASTAQMPIPSVALADDLPIFKVGTLPFGSLQWGVETIVKNGFDKAAGLTVEEVPLASSEASRVAFLSGSVDTIFSDLLFAIRIKSEGKPVLFLPHFTTEGGLMVKASSPIKSIADLKGKSIGVAGGALDKNWLLLQAAAKQEGQIDLATESRAVFGAPPLLAAKVESGEIDCGLLYWTYCARLEAKGYRQVFVMDDIVEALGAKGKIAFGGYLFQSTTNAKLLAAFSKASRQADELLASQPDAWTPIKPLMKAPDAATFDALKKDYLDGLPHKSRAAEIADAQAFFSIFVKIGGASLVGGAQNLPTSLYVDPAIYG